MYVCRSDGNSALLITMAALQPTYHNLIDVTMAAYDHVDDYPALIATMAAHHRVDGYPANVLMLTPR
jgi:hypothetical protein